MKDFPVALQLYSVREDMEADFAGTLQKVKEIGYDGVEFAGLFGHDAREVNKMCKDAGLVPISAHVPFQWAGRLCPEDSSQRGCVGP